VHTQAARRESGYLSSDLIWDVVAKPTFARTVSQACQTNLHHFALLAKVCP
jgi:hypothetical protein